MAAAVEENIRHETPELADEARLVAAVRRNDRQACEAFVRDYGGRLLGTARRFLHCEQDAADAVQEAFISAFQSIVRFEGHSRLGTWLHRIVVNVCLMKLRSRSRKQEISIEGLLPTFDDSGHFRPAPILWNKPDEDRLQSEEMRTIIRECIQMLPDEYRSVLVLRDLEELSTEESAKLLQTTVGAVKTRLHRARQALRTLLEPYFAV